MGLLAGIDTFTGWTLLQSNGSAIESSYAAANGDTANIAYFKSIASTLTSPQALLSNYRALSFVTTAFGLGSEVNQTAILSKLMTQNPNEAGSLAQQLASNNYRNFAGALSNWSPPPFSNPTALANIISDYQANSFETEVGQDNSTLGDALYFQKNAVGATNINQLMADPTLLNVVETAEGIPTDAFGNLDYNQQLAILQSRVNMSQFSTQAGVNAYVQKYLAMNQVQSITNGTATSNPLLALFSSGSGSASSSGTTNITAGLITAQSLNLTLCRMAAHRRAARRPPAAQLRHAAVPEPTLRDGLQHQQAGALGQAALVYRAVLRREPANALARTLLGLTLCQSGEPEQGLRTIREAIGLGNDAFAFYSLGQALAELGRPVEAVLAFRDSLAVLPGAATTHLALGDALRSLDQPAPAAEAYRAALALTPSAAGHLALGQMLRRLGQNADAARVYREGLALERTSAELWSGLANALVALGKPHEAVTAAHLAIELNDRLADAHFNFGNALRAIGERTRATAAYRAALTRNPAFPEAACNLSAVQYADWEFEDAVAAAELAINLRPNYPEALTNLANALQAMLRFAEAEAIHRRVVALAPSAMAHSNLAVVLTAVDRLDEALAEQRHALALSPDFVDARYNHAVTLLKAGDYAEGWRYYESRWQVAWSPPRGFAQPQWEGEALDGRTILLHPEQGLGDTLMMARYAPLVAALGGRVILEAQRPLVRLLRCLPGVAEVVALGDALPPFDLQCPLFSVPRVMGTTLETVPNAVYLHADPALANAWRARIIPGGRLRAGLVWRGAAKIGPSVNRERSIDLAQLAPLAEIRGVDLYSLQKYEEGAPISPPAPGMILHDFTAEIGDFADTAALVAQLDLVIAVDTSTAHLAAGMGKPVLLMSRYGGCWRWLAHRSDNPWYPSLTVFRQPRPSDWAPVVEEVAAALRERVGRELRDPKP